MQTNRRKLIAVKKAHRLKNTIMISPAKHILYLSKTTWGHQHDYALFKREFGPALPWSEKKIL